MRKEINSLKETLPKHPWVAFACRFGSRVNGRANRRLTGMGPFISQKEWRKRKTGQPLSWKPNHDLHQRWRYEKL